jgi:glycosyltransferase involved in cell wall biosynthesis
MSDAQYNDATTQEGPPSDEPQEKTGHQDPQEEKPGDGASVTMVATPSNGTCGIGTYAEDLVSSFPDAVRTSKQTFNQDDRSARHFLTLAVQLVLSNSDTIHVQHEYGLFRRENSQWPGVMGMLFFPVLFVLNSLVGKTIVVTMHSVLKPDPEEASLRIRLYLVLMHELIANGSDHVVFLSEQCKDRFLADVEVDADEYSVFPHGVTVSDTSDRSTAESKEWLGYDADDTVVMIPGFIRPPKGHDIFIEVAQMLPEYEFLVAGGGRPKGDDLDYANRIKATAPDNVTVTGVLDDDEFPDALNAADLAFLPYRVVSQSGTFNWCVAHALPVVASDEPYFSSIERDWGCVKTVDIEDLEEVTDTIQAVLNSEKTRGALVENARAYRRENSFERVAELHYHIYNGGSDERLPGEGAHRSPSEEANEMERFPRAARNARIKCLQCNAPATETVDGKYVCVSCGIEVLQGKTVPDQ